MRTNNKARKKRGAGPPPPHGGAPPQNPHPHNRPPPKTLAPRLPLERVEQAVSKAHRDLLASGESVSAWGITSLALIDLEAESFNTLGFRIPQIQSLNRLMLLEAKVNTFIHCFVGVWKITSLHDLNVAICKSEGIQRYDELELGPLLRHPLVIYYFLVPSDIEEIVNITSGEIISYLLEFLDQHRHVTTDEFLDFIAIKRAQPVKEKLGIRIQSLNSLKMYVKFIREAKKIEDCTVANYLSKMSEEGRGKCIPSQEWDLKKQFRNILRSGNSFSPIHKDSVGKHTRYDSFSLEDEDEHTEIDDKDVKDDSALRSSIKIRSQNRNISDQSVSSCVYPSASIVETVGQSSPAITRVICEENKRVSAMKRKCESQIIDNPFKLSKRDRADSSGHDLELLEDHDGGKSQCIKVKSARGRVERIAYVKFTKEAMNDFITTWKDDCRLLPVSQVICKMFDFYRRTSSEGKRPPFRKIFKSLPCSGLLHVAVESIKNGMWDGFYDTFQVNGEPGHITSTSAPTEPANISVEPSRERDALFKKKHSSQLNPSVNIDDICKKVSTYFDLSQTIPVEGKSIWEKQLTFFKKLHDCQQWLTKQFGVKEFGNLGCGEFHIFLEKHPSLFPNELVERLFVDESNKSTFEVSMCSHQLVMLLSQAESCLRRNEALTKEHMYKLLSKQFPVISLLVSSSGLIEDVSEFLRKHKNAANSRSVLYSVTFLGSDYANHSVIQTNMSENTGVNPDFVFIAGALGSVSAKDAVECLLKAPMLIDLQSWSHWDLIYAPTLGPLVEWLVNGVYMKELLCLVTKDGKIIRLDNSATVDEFLEAILKGSAREAAVKLLSLFSVYGGEGNVPLSILKFHSQRGIENILIISMESVTVQNSSNFFLPDGKSLKLQYAQETTAKQPLLNLLGKNLANLDLQDQHRINKAVSVASGFILDCLCHLPSEFRSFAADVLLSGLQSFIKDAPSTILRECSQTDHRLMLHSIGLSLNICEWVTDYHAFSSGASNDLSLSIAAANPQVSSPVHGFLKFKRDALEDFSVSDDKMVIDNKTDKHPVVIAEVCDCKVNDVSTEKSGDGTRSNLPKSNRNHDGALLVESIRLEEFGLVSSQTEADNIMLKKQHARLGRALQCLSQELYSQDSHFLLELVQNADDNLYSKTVEPTLVFILQSTGIVVLNNEQGFTAENIRALCDVGNSTKKGSIAGYIGQKGIGFKSVFRVTDAPAIHSNGFNVKFDITEGQIGFVLPTVVPYCDTSLFSRLLPDEADKTDAHWNTCIVLPFKSKLREGMGLSSIVSLFSDLQPSLLLFLHRLQCIKFKNLLNDTYTVMKRENLEDGIVKVSHGEEIMSWFVASQNLQASSLRPDVQTTKISVAFTLKEFSDGEYSPHLEQQPVYAFLPLRTYGLKFILQGDFVLPSSREEVDADSAWNQWLLSKFPDLFVSAQRTFCDLRCFQERPGIAVAAYMSFVPLVGEVHGFFSQLPRMIISKLRMSNCLLVDDKEVWVPPCRVLRGWNEQARIILPDDLLRQHLGLSYLDKDISLSDSLAKALGVSEYGPRILIEIISAVCSCEEGIKSICFDWLSSWLSSLFMMFAHSSGHPSVNALVESDLIGILKRIPFIPLSDGKYGSIAEGTIWLTSEAVNCGFEGQYESEVFAKLYANLRLVSPAFLSAAAVNARGIHDLTVDNVIKMLFKIGVQKLVAHELIKVHILPALSDNRTAERDTNLMVEYLSFVMLHLQSTCPSCQTVREIFISELQAKAFILTNHGFKRAAEVPVHFSRAFGNPVDMTKLIDIMDSDWHEVDSIYLKHSSNKSLSFGLMKWRDFFQGLGVTDFVQTVLIEKDIADMSHTLFNDIMHDRDLIVSGLVVKDWESPELVHLLSTLSSRNNREKSKYLLEVLDKMWDDCFCAKARGCITTKSGEDVKQFKSSFTESINDIQWMPSSIDQKLHRPKDLFCDCKEVRSILGNFAPYSLPLGRSRFIFGDIGLKTHITIEDALETLQVMRNFKAPVAASIDQMSKLYAIICNQMGTAKAEIARGFSSRPSIFLPTKDFRHEDVISGKLFSSEEVFWHDPTGLLDLTKEILIQCNSLSETYYSINKTLANVYPGFRDFFVNECKVCEIPPLRSYIQILVQLSKVTLPSQSANAVLRVLLKWANDLKFGLLESEDATYLKECLLKLETTILPTGKDKWVSLHPTFGLVCWCDKEELWKEFEHCDNIAFLYFGEISHDEKQVLSAKISGVMQALGVPSLSELITREAIFWGTNDCTEKALLVTWVLPYAQRYIYKMHPDKYMQLYQSGFENICNLQIVVVQKLFYRHTVKGCSSASNKQTECSCLLQENTLYVDRASNSHPIFMELSRLFFNGTPELHLANFLHLIRVMAESGSTEVQIDLFLVNNQKIPKLPDEEPVWFLSYLLSQQVDDGNIQPSSVSAAMEEQNMSKFKTRPDFSTNWPSSWRAALDSNFAQENLLWKECTVPPPTDSLQKMGKTKNISCKKKHEVPVGTGVDWIIESTSIESTTDIVQDLGARLEKPLHGSSSHISRRTSSSSAGLNQAFGTNAHQAAITGRTGELVASKYFAKKVTGSTVKWVNEDAETGLPYDIVIGDSEESKEYIEVKATHSVKKDWFAISTGEWQFAVDKGESFSIAHVFLEGPSNAKVTVFKNPAKLCRQGTLCLAVLMPNIQENM